MKEKINWANHHGRISEKSDTSSRRASGRSSGGTPEKGVTIGHDSSMWDTVPEDLPTGQDVETEESDMDGPDPV